MQYETNKTLKGIAAIDFRSAAATYAEESGQDVEQVLAALERACVQAAEKLHGEAYRFDAKITESGRLRVVQLLEVVETVTDPNRQVSLVNIRKSDPKAELGSLIVNPIEPVIPEGLFPRGLPTDIKIKSFEITVA